MAKVKTKVKIKAKTKRALYKRIIQTASGEWKHKKAYRGHLAGNKSTKQKRHLRKSTLVDRSDFKRLKSLLSA